MLLGIVLLILVPLHGFLSFPALKMKQNYCRYPAVEEFVAERLEAIVSQQDQSTFLYWWNEAGLSTDTIIFEAAHNILAFVNYVHTLFLLIRAKNEGMLGVQNLQLFLQGQFSLPPLDFFQAYKDANSDNERLDVTREAFRLLIPAQFSFSNMDFSDDAANNNGKLMNDPDFTYYDSLHFHLLIQASNDNYNVLTGATDAGTYDTGRYADFQPQGCPHSFARNFDANDFAQSVIDGETVVPESHKEYFPVFAAGSLGADGAVNGPKYCPFGLGYRKCPAELFNYFVLGMVLDELKGIDFLVPDGQSLFADVTQDSPGAVSISVNTFALDNIDAIKVDGDDEDEDESEEDEDEDESEEDEDEDHDDED